LQLGKHTVDLLASLDVFSGYKLTRHNDLGLLVELASRHSLTALLDELSFQAKFVTKTHGIMQRIGMQDDGYDKLSREFTTSIEKSTSLIKTLLPNAPVEDRQQFTSTYLTMTQESLQHLLALCYDLSWYKNWRMDQRRRRGR
jgi:hypothetical protein